MMMTMMEMMMMMMIAVEKMAEPAASVTWNDVLSTDEWLDRQPVEQWKKQFDEKGFLVGIHWILC